MDKMRLLPMTSKKLTKSENRYNVTSECGNFLICFKFFFSWLGNTSIFKMRMVTTKLHETSWLLGTLDRLGIYKYSSEQNSI